MLIIIKFKFISINSMYDASLQSEKVFNRFAIVQLKCGLCEKSFYFRHSTALSCADRF